MNSFRTARLNGLKSIAFPAISCGGYGYPLLPAARIALSAARDEMAAGYLERIVFALFADEALNAYREVAAELSL